MVKKISKILFFTVLVVMVAVFMANQVLANDFTKCEAGNYIIEIVEPFPILVESSVPFGDVCSGVYPCWLFRYQASGKDSTISLSKIGHILGYFELCRSGNQISLLNPGSQLHSVCEGDTNTIFGNQLCGGRVADVNPVLSDTNPDFYFATNTSSVDIFSMGVDYGGRGGGLFGCSSPIGSADPTGGILGPACSEGSVTQLTQDLLTTTGVKFCIEGQVAVCCPDDTTCTPGEVLTSVPLSSLLLDGSPIKYIDSPSGQAFIIENDAENTTYWCNPYTRRCYYR